MMVRQRMEHPPAHVRDQVGARRDVLVWDYGVVTGHVVAVQVLDSGAADLVIEFEQPQPEVVDDDLCSRVQDCRADTRCPFWAGCAAHEHEREQ